MYFNSNMTFDERERFAYANGDFKLVGANAAAAELEDEVASLEDQLEYTRKEQYQLGYNEGFGTDHVEILANMEHERDKANETTEKSKVLVREMLALFHNDKMKTVAGRKQLHQHLQTKLIQLGY